MIDQPGIFNISATDYHADPCPQPSLSASIANVLLDKSPAHARMQHKRLCPDAPSNDESRLELGSAAHSLLLEQDGSAIEFLPHNDFRTNAAKDARDAARNAGKLPILSRYEPILREMVRIAMETIDRSELAGLFNRGKAEQTLAWRDEGIWCRARVDFLVNDYSTILEYKSTASAAPQFFTRQVGNLGYDCQAEFYRRGLAALELHDNPVQIILAQEVEAPHACALYTLSNDYIDIAQHKVERAIQTWRMCIESGIWPAYGDGITVIYPPAWESHAYAQRLALEGDNQ